jgi:Holliday junction resolvase
METEFAEIKELFKKTAAQFEETAERFNKTDALFEKSRIEADARSKELAIQFKETDKKIKEAFDLFTSQWGRLMESLVEGDIVNLFRNRGIVVRDTSMRRKGSHEGKDYEFDIIAQNGKETVFVEVKTTLKVKEAKDFLVKMKKVRTWLRMDDDEIIYGAMAYLQANAGSEVYSQNQNLFVIRATGDSAAIINASDFVPGKF